MKTVVATGVFAILHLGHLLFLKDAKNLGDKLIVIVARDDNVRKKKRDFVIPEQQRLEVIKAVKYVDKAILGDKKDIFKPIEKLKPAIIALGKNQDVNENYLREELKKRKLKTKVVRIEKFFSGELNSTRKIIEKIKKKKL